MRPVRRGLLQPNITPQLKRPPVAPAVYRAQPLPRVLQQKVRPGGYLPGSQAPQGNAKAKAIVRPQAICAQRQTTTLGQAHNRATIYRPQARAVNVQAGKADSLPQRNQPVAPPVYHPQSIPRVLQRKVGAPVTLVRSSAHFATRRPAGSIIQRSKDGEWIPPWEKPKKKQYRPNFLTNTPENVTRRTGHSVVHFDQTRFNAVYTCPTCKRWLAYEDKGGVFHLTEYGYLSESGNVHRQRSLTLDHHPDPWAKRLKKHKKDRSTDDVMRQDYQDESKLRALCKVCNESHEYENEDVEDYSSDSEDDNFGPDRTPKHETQYNTGSWSGYRDPGWLSGY